MPHPVSMCIQIRKDAFHSNAHLIFTPIYKCFSLYAMFMFHIIVSPFAKLWNIHGSMVSGLTLHVSSFIVFCFDVWLASESDASLYAIPCPLRAMMKLMSVFHMRAGKPLKENVSRLCPVSYSVSLKSEFLTVPVRYKYTVQYTNGYINWQGHVLHAAPVLSREDRQYRPIYM